MPRTDYLPARDQDLLAWSLNASSRITANPVQYGLDAPAAVALAALVADYQTRLASATNPVTRTSVTTSAKEISKKALKAKIRSLMRIVNADPDTTDPLREELGLRPRDVEPSPMPVPPTRPLVTVEPLGGMQIGIRMRDEATPDSRAKPVYGSGAYLWAKVGDAAPLSLAECSFLGTATRTKHVVTQPPSALNKTCWIIAQWVNDKGETGPTSVPASVSVAA